MADPGGHREIRRNQPGMCGKYVVTLYHGPLSLSFCQTATSMAPARTVWTGLVFSPIISPCSAPLGLDQYASQDWLPRSVLRCPSAAADPSRPSSKPGSP